MAKTNEELTELIYQLWQCLAKGYTYDEAKIHMNAYAAGKTTVNSYTRTIQRCKTGK